MDQGPHNSPSASLRAEASTSSHSRRLVLWATLGIVLALAFLVDGLVVEMVGPLRTSALSEFLRNSVRWLGTGYVQIAALLPVSVGGMLFRTRWHRGVASAFLAFAASGVAVTMLKVLIHRPRPWSANSLADGGHHVHTSDCYAFPSGETTTTFAIAVVLASWYPALRVPLFAVAAIVGVARILVGSHHPSDVVAGALLGVATAQIVIRSTASMGRPKPVPRVAKRA